MANPGGSNQFGNYTIQPQYGDVAKQSQLARSAPMSGAPMVKPLLGAPKRLQRRAAKGRPPEANPAPPPVAVAQPQGPTPNTFQTIAQIPGASPLVQSIFGG